MGPATVRQCVIPVNCGAAGQPALRHCGDRPALAWVLRECVRFGIETVLLLASGDSAAIQAGAPSLLAGLPRPVRIEIAPGPADTTSSSSAALLHARERLGERFLLCPADMVFDANLARLLAMQSPSAPLGYMLRCAHGAGDGALGLFSRSLLDVLPPGAPLPDALSRLAADGLVQEVRDNVWCCDLANPEQFAVAQQAVPRRLRRPALLLDRDGVLNVDHGYVGTQDRFDWIPGALDAIRHATQAGWHVFVVTNQSGVARGFYDEAAVQSLMAWMAEQAHHAGGTIDDTRYCPYHEDAAVEVYRRAHHWRKPQPGMLLDLIRSWDLDPRRCVMIGDQQSDMQAAAAAGMTGHMFRGGNLLAFVRPLIGRVD